MYISLWTISSNTFYILSACALLSAVVLCMEAIARRAARKTKQTKKGLMRLPPSPTSYPVIGNLYVLDGYEIPYQAFTDLGAKLGNIISLQLGSVPAVVVNGIENIREVLITKSNHFDSRPNFSRYHRLFSGNKENSLAFCNWSDLHKLRRDMLTPHTFPKSFSKRFQDLNAIIGQHAEVMLHKIDAPTARAPHAVDIKAHFLKTSANIFNEYFCSETVDYDSATMDEWIVTFDKVFYEVNQGYAADFLPFLTPLRRKPLNEMDKCSRKVREFVVGCLIKDRFDNPRPEEIDYLDSIIKHVKASSNPLMPWDTAIFALEDMIGGHAAVGNFLAIVVKHLIDNPVVQERIQAEVDAVMAGRAADAIVTLDDRSQMQYTQAVLMEALRVISSPIVPHVSNQDTTINGYDVPANTLIFLNNYGTNMSTEHWDEPTLFKPERFLNAAGQLIKPEFFLPFGAGRRSCMGYKFVQFISFSLLTNTLRSSSLRANPACEFKIQPGSLAILDQKCSVLLEPRH